MQENVVDQLIPKVVTWPGVLFLVLVAGLGLQFFGREMALGMMVGMVVGLINFKAIAFILKQVLGPDSVHKVLYAVFGFLKFSIIVGVFYILVYHQLFDVYGIVSGFSTVLLLVLLEGLLRASQLSRDEFMEERENASSTGVS